MRFLLPRVFFCSVCCLVWQFTSAQVRIGGMRGMQEKGRHRIKQTAAKNPVIKGGSAQVRFKAYVPSTARKQLDNIFFVSWSAQRSLDYDDFKCNKSGANKFLSEKDSVGAQIVYPDYRMFYRMLSEKTSGIADVADTAWYASVERFLSGSGTPSGDDPEALFDSGFAFSIAVDSPAASVVNILPVIYQVNENTWYYNISALFSKNESWMLIRSNDILAHEQIHFDIFELYARRMRKLLAETLKSNYVTDGPSDLTIEITPGFEQYYQLLNDLQVEFDKQTMKLTGKNQSILEINASWSKKIRDEIAALCDYAAPEGFIELN